MKAMSTPISDFIERTIAGGAARLHVPGHKGVGPLGCEPWDITEIAGADELYAASGIIAESERNAAAHFGTAATFYSCEGSSLCIRAMLALAMTHRAAPGKRPVALAARNAHKAFLYAAALCDFDVEWLVPGPRPAAASDPRAGRADSLCACPGTPGALAARLDALAARPFCVYVTSPDYLGGVQDIAGLSQVCHRRGVPLIVDNAHGAYLKFLPESRHPMDLGADLCCDSAHKTLPVLTGGAYLHVSKAADPRFAEGARQALALFGSTSPSYLILQSLDRCNAALAGDWPERLRKAAARVDTLRQALRGRGFREISGEPMKLTLEGDGFAMAEKLRAGGVECEYADRRHVVLMFSPDSRDGDFERVDRALDAPLPLPDGAGRPGVPRLQRAMTIREAVFAASETVPVREAAGRVCAAPAVACPPAIPIAVSGEVLDEAAVKLFLENGLESVRVVREGTSR